MQIIMPESLIEEINELTAAKKELATAASSLEPSSIGHLKKRIEFLETEIAIACEALVLNAAPTEKTNN